MTTPADGPRTDALALTDPLALAQAMIRCPSVTPADAGCLDVLEHAMASLGFDCHRMVFSEDGTPDIDNLYVRLGDQSPNFCYAGHTDVVPVGDVASWTVDPFGAGVIDGVLYGRGAADMKGGIACFVAAVAAFLEARQGDFDGSISMLITGDEEGLSINGTIKMLKWLEDRGETLDVCVVGEPTNPEQLGDMVKIGRRGSLVGHLTLYGTQGHTAYPHLADNPVPRLLKILTTILEHEYDSGTEHFPASTIEVTTIDIGNPAANIIPARVSATFNIRFNDLHSSESLIQWLGQILDQGAGRYDLETHITGEPFLCPPGELSRLLSDAVQKATGRVPELSTTGGTSDARFIHHACPVAEFGLIGQTMHKTDERVAVSDLTALSDIYRLVLEGYFPQK